MTTGNDVTVCIPSIPPRMRMLNVAINSVLRQTMPPAALSLAIDNEHDGAAVTRTRAVMGANTPWVAMLDDDDEFLSNHLAILTDAADRTGADFVFSWFHVIGGNDPFPQHFGKTWDPENPTHTTVTTMVRTELAQSVGYVSPPDGDGAGGSGEDWNFTLGCLAAGAKIVHVPVRSWRWNHHGKNTSGRSDRW